VPKKTTILILILSVVTGILLFLAVRSETGKQPTTATVPTKKPLEKTAKVFFSPANIDLSTGSATSSPTVDIFVDTGNSEIAGVQAEIQYDPNALVNVKLFPSVDASSFFGTDSIILFNDVIQESGRISYAIAISSNQRPKKGVGKIATFSFQKAFNSRGATTVAFLEKTLVTVLGENESALKETMPLNIVLSTQTTSPFVPVTIFPTATPAGQ